jgi:YidC/Oxa1 family membrane protein insertase
MDKRFFLALLLTGAVVILTPVLFKRPPVTPAPIVADSGAVATPPAATPQPAAAPSGALTQPTIAPRDTDAAPAIVAEDHVLGNELATFHFSNYGAQLARVEMPRFRRLGTEHGDAELVHRDAPMLGFRLIAGRDTIALDRVPFAVTRTAAVAGDSASRENLTFRATLGGASIAINYALAADDYLTRVTVEGAGLPQPAFLLISLPSGFTSQEADTIEDSRHLAYAYKTPTGGAERVDFRKPDPGERLLRSGPFTWAVAKNKYFLVGVLAADSTNSPFAELHVTGELRERKIATRAQGTIVAPIGAAPVAFDLYAGPQEWKRLLALGREFENSNPYGGWISVVVQPFATIVMRLLLWLKAALGIEYGWILVLFGIAVRVVLWPLNGRAMRSQMQMQRVAPLLQEAQKKFASDPEKQRAAMMKVYADNNMSPMSGLAGCLPLLLPMPIFIALFFVFQNTIEFRGVSFLWLADISLKDPYYITPIAMGISMFAMSWIGMRNSPPNPQAKMMAYLMPPLFTIFLLNFASGLNLYYTVQNLASLPQQWLISNERAKFASTTTTTVPAKKT